MLVVGTYNYRLVRLVSTLLTGYSNVVLEGAGYDVTILAPSTA